MAFFLWSVFCKDNSVTSLENCEESISDERQQRGQYMKKRATAEINAGISIGDVSRICGVPNYTIRYWEREFKEELSPTRTEGKQRRYSDDDINKLLMIKKLLWADNFSIKGAKRILKGNVVLSHFNGTSNRVLTDTHDLAMQIAQLINTQLSVVQPAA